MSLNGPQRQQRQEQYPPTTDARPGSSSSASGGSASLPPLSLSILGVEPLDEFIKEVADFVHHMITTKPEHLVGTVEVEAKVGRLKDTRTGQRLGLPVLVESSECYLSRYFVCTVLKRMGIFVFVECSSGA